MIYRNELRCDLVIPLMAMAGYLDRKTGVKSVTLISRPAFARSIKLTPSDNSYQGNCERYCELLMCPSTLLSTLVNAFDKN